jgi:uncharacterized protein YbjT (DUF2867 family)
MSSNTPEKALKTIAVAGASGFIGKHLIQALLEDAESKGQSIQIIALSRNEKNSNDPRVEWRLCDLFSLSECQRGLKDCDAAYYLVHSMLPTAHLDQGRFWNYDLLLADNFARACEKQGLKKVVYLSGIIPKERPLSRHLKSRLEVEELLADGGFELTSLRAGLVVGGGGSSFRILYRLVSRLPFLVCPSWTQNKTTPIYIDDAVICLKEALYNPEIGGKSWDIGGPDTLTYLEMMKETAKQLGKKRFFIPVAFLSTYLSRLWVSTITQSPRNLVYPLIMSLKSPMVLREERRLKIPGHSFKSFKEAIEIGVQEEAHHKDSRFQELRKTFTLFRPVRKSVRSVQRLKNPKKLNADQIRQEYMRWLPKALYPFVKVFIEGNLCELCLFRGKTKLLILELDQKKSTPDRQLLMIRGGLLARIKGKGRLEFRKVHHYPYVLAAIHEFYPSLPWYLYKYTQAFLHLLVMKRFARHLVRIKPPSGT